MATRWIFRGLVSTNWGSSSCLWWIHWFVGVVHTKLQIPLNMFFDFTLIFICLYFAGLCEAAMDALAHYYEQSIFKKLNPNYWNPVVSGVNKWKNGDRTQGERFFLSSTLLVGFTEGWHLFKMGRTLLLFSAIAVITGWFIALLMMCVFKGSFTLYYKTFREN